VSLQVTVNSYHQPREASFSGSSFPPLDIREPIKYDMIQLEKRLLQTLNTKVDLLNKSCSNPIRIPGRRLRPALLFLFARMMGDLDEKALEAAQAIELVHSATLLHDGCLEDTNKPQPFSLKNPILDNRVSILVGDFLLAKAFNKMAVLNDFQLNNVLTKACIHQSEGELLDLQLSRNLDLSEKSYFEMITNKTAALIAAACTIGAIIGTRNKTKRHDQIWKFGINLACTYQIYDDLTCYRHQETKPQSLGCHDLKRPRITLPLVYAFQRNRLNSKQLRYCLVKNKRNELSPEIRELIIHAGGVGYAHRRANEFMDRASSILALFSENVYRQTLEEIVRRAPVGLNQAFCFANWGNSEASLA